MKLLEFVVGNFSKNRFLKIVADNSKTVAGFLTNGNATVKNTILQRFVWSFIEIQLVCHILQ